MGFAPSLKTGRSESFSFQVNELKARVHDRLIEILDLSLIDKLDQQTLRQEITRIIERILAEEKFTVPMNSEEKARFCQEVQDEVLGLGPIEPLMHDPTVTDILVNAYDHIYVERFGKLQLTDAHFKDNAHLKKIIDRIVSNVGRRIDESCPMVDARLADGSRVNAIIPPLAIDGPMLSIRRFSVDPLEMDDLITLRTLTPEIGELLKGIVASRLNVLISGGQVRERPLCSMSFPALFRRTNELSLLKIPPNSSSSRNMSYAWKHGRKILKERAK
jgi:pilus assembly protein CpaF